MQQVAVWLEKLGLGQYAQRFAENDISFSVLPDLTDQHLKELGVSLGHRLQLLRAIANLDKTAVASAPATARPPPATTPIAPPGEAAGERRHVTVMFCDLVDSTGIAARLDAEEWRDLVGAYLAAASAAVTEMGGKVAKKLGDGLMALFGYPVAQENDAERAARAALAIQRALADLNRKNEGTSKPALAARIAIDSGPVVVDSGGEIFGDVPNVAARAQALAEPGTVVVTSRVQRQVAGLFIAEDHGSHDLKGVPEPVMLYRIIRASGGGRRASQRHLTPLVGREEEIAMLMRRWERARQGDGQLLMIVGEPGLGKSRLIGEFHARLRDVPHTWVEWNCSQLLQNTPLHPFAEWGRIRFRWRGRNRRAAPRRFGGFAVAGQDRPGGKCPFAGAAPGHSAVSGTPLGFAGRRIAAAAIGGTDRLGERRSARPAGGFCVRGRALGRSDDPRFIARRRRTRCAGTITCSRHCAAGISHFLEYPVTSRNHFAFPPRPPSGSAHDRRACRSARSAEEPRR
jgi:class 3 adenylate cyclase